MNSPFHTILHIRHPQCNQAKEHGQRDQSGIAVWKTKKAHPFEHAFVNSSASRGDLSAWTVSANVSESNRKADTHHPEQNVPVNPNRFSYLSPSKDFRQSLRCSNTRQISAILGCGLCLCRIAVWQLHRTFSLRAAPQLATKVNRFNRGVTAFQKIHTYVQGFSDPLEAIAALSSEGEKPALLITDFIMEPTNGGELIQRAMDVIPNLKTVLMSGYLGGVSRLRGKSRPDAFLKKPFELNELIDCVTRLLKEERNVSVES